MISTVSEGSAISRSLALSRATEAELVPILTRHKLYGVAKRVVDIAGSAVFIACVLSWLVPVLAVLIRLDSRGPVFFLQWRVGKYGKAFRCFKFRTMVVNAQADWLQATHHDGRITRLGKFLRESNLDEFPQFINVLLGHMSIVGPRPHMLADFRRFSALIPGYSFRNLIRPGITGLSQVKGYCGPAADPESISQRFQWDRNYVQQANFWLDLKIIGLTAKKHIRFLMEAL